jgi:hypothetical protein
MTISQIRSVMDTADWTRLDLSGHTREEFIRRDVPQLLLPQIAAMRALVIHPRFTRDLERRSSEITRCEAVIERWRSLQSPQQSAPLVSIN